MGLGGIGSALGMGSSKTKVPGTGFYAMPQQYQDLWNNVLKQTKGVAGSLNTDAFTPLPQTEEETRAIGSINAGLGTPETFNKNIEMLMNPFDEYVVNDINRQSMGQNSLVNQAGQQAGQMGSNRNFLNTSDVEQNRLNNIGVLRQGQYNTAVSNALGPLAGLQQQDITNLLGVGGFQRDLDSRTNQAPYTALAANQGALSGIPTQFGNFGSAPYTMKSGGGLGGIMGGLGSLGGLASGASSAMGALGMGGSVAGGLGSLDTALSFFSDRRVKDGIEEMGTENGHKVYKFHYKDDPDQNKFIGVMAQDILETNPDAVSEVGGVYVVDYGKLGIEMRAA